MRDASPIAAVTFVLAWCFAGCAPALDEPARVERVILIAIDGVDWRVLDPLLRDGAMPNLAAFLERGARGGLATIPPEVAPTYSPIIWASVATGKLPAEHGITGFGRSPDGSIAKMVPYTSNSRRAAALWNLLSEHGRRVAVVGWWTTWPAEPVNGVVVSDRLVYNRLNLWLDATGFGERLPAMTHPAELIDEIAGLVPTEDELLPEFFERFRGGAPVEPLRPNLHDPWYELFLAYGRDATYGRVLDYILRDQSFDLVAYYLNGTDIASHYFWKYHFPREWSEPIDPRLLLERRDVIARYHTWIDERIAPLLEQADERTLVVVLSDHGFETGARSDSAEISGTHYRTAPPGILAIAGGGVAAGSRIDGASIFDIAPTVLHALGLAVADDMAGSVLPAVRRGVASGPVRHVATYDDGSRPDDHEPIPSEADAAIVEKLSALGYLGSPGAVDDGSEP